MKKYLLDAAEVVDAWRVFPRLFVGLFMWVFGEASFRYMVAVPPDQWHHFLTWLGGFTGAITGFYVASGRKWG